MDWTNIGNFTSEASNMTGDIASALGNRDSRTPNFNWLGMSKGSGGKYGAIGDSVSMTGDLMSAIGALTKKRRTPLPELFSVYGYGGYLDDDNKYVDGGIIGNTVSTGVGLIGNTIQNAQIADTSELENTSRTQMATLGNTPFNATSNDSLLNDYTNNYRLVGPFHVGYKDLRNKSFMEDLGNSFSASGKGFSAGAAFGPIGAAVGGIFGGATSLIGSIIGRHKAKKKARRLTAQLNRQADAANLKMNESFDNSADNTDFNNNLNALINLDNNAAYGGLFNVAGRSINTGNTNTYDWGGAVDKIKSVIKGHEGWRSSPYRDIGGTRTIGYGFTDAGFRSKYKEGITNRFKRGMSKAEGERELDWFLTNAAKRLSSLYGNNLSEGQMEAILDTYYQQPAAVDKGSKFYKAFTSGSPNAINYLGVKGFKKRNNVRRALFNGSGNIPTPSGGDNSYTPSRGNKNTGDYPIFTTRTGGIAGNLMMPVPSVNMNFSVTPSKAPQLAALGRSNVRIPMIESPAYGSEDNGNNNNSLSTMQRVPTVEDILGGYDKLFDTYNEFKNGGGIHIKKSKEGTFTAAAKKHHMGVQEFANRVLANPDNYSSAMRKKANFARNASHWNAYGGYLDIPNLYPLGGDLQVSNPMLENINEGGTHEQNPNGGVPVSVDDEGNPNLVEQGESIWKGDYVFSNRLKVPETIRKKYNLKKGATFADAAKYIGKEAEQRPYDNISNRTQNELLGELSDYQEEKKFKNAQRQEERRYALGGNVFKKGGVTPYAYSKSWDGFNYFNPQTNEYAPEYLDFVNNITDQQAADILAGKYGSMDRYRAKNKNRKLTRAQIIKLATDKKYSDMHKVMQKAYEAEGIPSKQNMQEALHSILTGIGGNNNTPIDIGKIKPIDIAAINANSSASRKFKPKPTWMRYAPIAGSFGMALANMLAKPDYGNANEISAAGYRLAAPVSIPVSHIGDYRSRKYMDDDLALIALKQSLAGDNRNTLNISGGNRAQALTGMSANTSAFQEKMAEVAAQAYLANRKEDADVAEFNRGTNQYNATADNQRNMEQAQINANREAQGLGTIAKGALLRQSIADQKDAALSANITNFLQGLGDIGWENEQSNWLNSPAMNGVYHATVGSTGVTPIPSTARTVNTVNTDKCGGKLKKKRRF